MAGKTPKKPTDQSGRAMEPRGRIVALWSRLAANKWRASITMGVAAIAVMATFVCWALLAKQVVELEDPPTLVAALAAYDAGDFEEARGVIRKLQELDRLAPQEYGGPMFVLGAIKAAEAEEAPTQQRARATYLIAARYLEDARARGFPEGREDAGVYLLAKSQVLSAQYAASLARLEEALLANPGKSTEIHQLYTESLLGQTSPRLEDALKHNDAVLEDRLLSPESRAAALLTKSDILLRLGRNAECKELVSQLPKELRARPEIGILEGQLLMHDAEATLEDTKAPQSERRTLANKTFESAIELLRATQAADTEKSFVTRRAMYLIGLCYAKMGDAYVDAALDELVRLRRRYPDTPEGLVASLQEAEILNEHKTSGEAVEAYRRTLAAVGEIDVYRNRWLSLASLRSRILDARRAFIDSSQFDQALLLLDGASPTIPFTEAEELRAATYEVWGESRLARADAANAWDAPQFIREARHHFRHAGLIFEKVARLRFASRGYTDDLWRSAESYLRGQAYTPAVRVLTEYLRNEATARRPQALSRLGAAYLALGNMKRSIDALEECIELHHHDAAIFGARITCAQAFREQGELDRAKQLLLENLEGDALTPESPEWRESLFELGFLLHEEGRFEDSINKLTEAVERYPDAEKTVVARYLIADAYRRASQGPLDRYHAAQSKNEREKQLQLVEGYLRNAAEQFRRVQQSLTNASTEGDLAELDAAILRNSYLMGGSVLFDLKEYEQALEVFRNASSLYPSDPIVLETYVQIANCHRRMNRQVEARGALEQAKVVLRRIPSDADFTLATNLSREAWSKLLDDMSKW